MDLNFKDLSRRNQWIVVVVLASVVLVAFYFQKWAPGRQRADDLDAQIRQLEAEIRRTQQVAAELPELEAELERLQGRLEILMHILPEHREEDQLLRRVAGVAAESNLDIRKFTFQQPIEHEFYAEFPLELDLSGTYHNLARFFERIGNFARIINIDEVVVQANAESTSQTVRASCRAMTFIFVEDRATEETEESAGGAP